MKKKYNKPNSGNVLSYTKNNDIAPLGVGAALVGGYAIGRAAKQVFEVDSTSSKIKHIRKVVVY